MERRLFIQLPLVASVLLTEALKNPDDKPKPGGRPEKGFKVEARKDRYQEELHIMGGQFDCIVSAQDTDGDLCIYDTIRQEKGGPVLHLHHEQDEWFYIIKGEFIVKVGEDTFNLKAGDSAFAPRKIPHAFAKINDDEGQMLVLFQPAGTMEDFFKQMSKLGSSIPDNQGKLLQELWESHGMEVVGPPLTF